MFSQAGGVTDLLANEARCWAVMEKTHVGPMGGRIYIPGDRVASHIHSPTHSVQNSCDSGAFEKVQAQVGLNKSKGKVKFLMKHQVSRLMKQSPAHLVL